MISVSEETKRAFMSDLSHKKLRVVFPELNAVFENDSIESESLKLTEALATKDSIEFVGCIASSLEVKIYGIEQNIKGRRIEVYIQADDTDEIPVFKGYVDSAVIDSTSFFKTVIAYDELYTKGQVDVADWYKQIMREDQGITLKQIRNSLFARMGIVQKIQDLPNDNIVIKKQYDPTSLQALTVFKSICQINGCCGIINREGVFEYRFIKPIYKGLYPSKKLFPSENLFPEAAGKVHSFEFYEKLNFQEYFVKAMARVQVRESEDDIGYTVGASAGNKYIIQGNMFTYGLEGDSKRKIASNILNYVRKTEFFPFESKNYGLPYVEVGDNVEFVLGADRTGRYATSNFIVLNRTLSGVQLLSDTYSATGSEEQSEFITDLQSRLDSIKHTGVVMDNYYNKTDIDTIMDQFEENYMDAEEVTEHIEDTLNELETPTGFNVVSCYKVPKNRDYGTIYLVEGGVIML